MPTTRRRARLSANRQVNVTAPVNQLSPEIVAIIMESGLPGPRANERWQATRHYLHLIGSISSGWRQVRDETATLWSFVACYGHHTKRKSDTRLRTMELFLTRSKATRLHVVLDLPDYIGFKLAPLRALTIILPHLHRCRSLYIKHSGPPSSLSTIFPLPTSSNLSEISILSHSGWEDQLTLFQENDKSHLRSLSLLYRSAMSSLPTVNLTHIVDLDISHILADRELLSLASTLKFLKKLTLREISVRNDKGPYNGPSFSFPNLVELQIEDTALWDFPLILSTPHLKHLTISGSRGFSQTSPSAPSSFPLNLRSLVFNVWAPDDISMDFNSITRLNPRLQYLEVKRTNRIPELIDSLMPSFNANIPAHVDETGIPCPHLELLRITPGRASEISQNLDGHLILLDALLQRRPTLKVALLEYGLPPDLASAAESSSPRISVIPYPRPGENWPTPLSELA